MLNFDDSILTRKEQMKMTIKEILLIVIPCFCVWEILKNNPSDSVATIESQDELLTQDFQNSLCDQKRFYQPAPLQ